MKNKKLTSLIVLTLLSSLTYAQTKIDLQIDKNSVKNSENLYSTSLKSSGADYTSHSESGLDEYNLKKQEMLRKARVAAEEKRNQEIIKAQIRAQQQADAALKNKSSSLNSKSGDKNASNSLQSYYDRVNNPTLNKK